MSEDFRRPVTKSDIAARSNDIVTIRNTVAFVRLKCLRDKGSVSIAFRMGKRDACSITTYISAVDSRLGQN